MSVTLSKNRHRSTAKRRCSMPSATTASRNGVAITPCPILARCGRTTSGGRWSRKRGTKSKMLREPGTHTTISSKKCKKKLRAQGMRNIHGMSFQLNTTGNDSNALFDYFLIAYGGKDIVTEDGKLHIHDPAIKEAAIKTVTYPTTAYKEGFVPPGAINWNDADDNNAFHAKQIVMDLDGTISTEVAIIKKKQDYDDIETMGLPLSNDGKPVPSEALHTGGLIPQGAKNIE